MEGRRIKGKVDECDIKRTEVNTETYINSTVHALMAKHNAELYSTRIQHLCSSSSVLLLHCQ